jgi:hypothetical protein
MLQGKGVEWSSVHARPGRGVTPEAETIVEHGAQNLESATTRAQMTG